MKAYELRVCESYQVCEGWFDMANTNGNTRVSLLGCYIHKADGRSSKREEVSSAVLSAPLLLPPFPSSWVRVLFCGQP